MNYPYFFELTTKRTLEEGRKSEIDKMQRSKTEVDDPLAALFE
jgi:hypothetical protein